MNSIATSAADARYFSLLYLCKFENLNIERIKNSAKMTMFAFEKKQGELGFTSIKAFAKHYNAPVNGLITDREINHFYYHSKLEPYAHLIEILISDTYSQKLKNRNIKIDFGIRKTHYDYYIKHGRPPVVENRGRDKKYDLPAGENSRTKIEFTNGGAIDIPKDPIYLQWSDGIKRGNQGQTHKITKQERILWLMSRDIEENPEIFDKPVDVDLRKIKGRKRKNGHIAADIDPDVRQLIDNFVSRYNADNAVTLTLSQIIETACKSFLDRQAATDNLKYVDPKLWAKLKEQ